MISETTHVSRIAPDISDLEQKSVLLLGCSSHFYDGHGDVSFCSQLPHQLLLLLPFNIYFYKL